MGISLTNLADPHARGFSVNFWHWRALVEAVRRLNVVPDARAAALHDPFCGHGLTQEEAGRVADALETQLLPTLAEEQRVLLDGRVTSEPDDSTFYKGEDAHRNYSTNREVLLTFIRFLRECSGFEVD